MKIWVRIGMLGLLLALLVAAQFSPLKSKIYRNTAYAASGVATTQTNVQILSVTGFNNGPAQFVLLFDSATVPADTTGPDLIPIWAPANQNFSYDAITRGHVFANGIAWSNSNSGVSKAIQAADILVQIEYK